MPVLKEFTLYQGDTMDPLLVGLKSVTDLTGYTCNIAVAGTAIMREVTVTSGRYFVVQLTPSETGELDAGQSYRLGVQLSNPSFDVPFVKELHFSVKVEEQLVEG